jgi:hypothetical protein
VRAHRDAVGATTAGDPNRAKRLSLTPVRGQEREHTPGRHQMPDQSPRIQQLPVRTLFALHKDNHPRSSNKLPATRHH